ncbi:unnamed protein product [Polarella glacialis]|uniref:Carbohydrate kinase PfkB domain-containing protein n=1 Tax=Polarella glacialis TaxID=89957 RepID=A0A813KJL6_POLGL|nr:unnamed protein product [Polarella glacialis]|mmetsp:Transcript_44830/g.81173  ORF Transcript_44830/g.81173 Transcript_44830/m.81173 type:complete len:367 (-) Transcript_44830:26-1126(-)
MLGMSSALAKGVAASSPPSFSALETKVIQRAALSGASSRIGRKEGRLTSEVRHFSGQSARGLRVLAIGNTIIDTVLTMPRIPFDDKVWIDSRKRFVGGQGANAAQGMARLGLHLSWLSRLGADDDGLWAQNHFREQGMDTSHCMVVPNAQTMSACVTIGTDCMTRCCFMFKDRALFEYDISLHLSKIDLSNFDVVYTDGHQMDLALPVVQMAFTRGLSIVADIEVLDEETRLLASLATDIIGPDHTIQELAGHSDTGRAAHFLADRPGKTVIATMGKNGSFGASHGHPSASFVQAHPECRAFDTLGAGDAYHAGYLAAMSRNMAQLTDRMSFATSVAAAVCETHGPVPSLEALERFGCLPAARGAR